MLKDVFRFCFVKFDSPAINHFSVPSFSLLSLYSKNNMKSIWSDFVLRQAAKIAGESEDEISGYMLAKGFREWKQSAWRLVKDIALISVGVFSAAFGLESFLVPTGFIDGGATGISLLASQLTHIPLSVYIVLVNIPFVIIGYNLISKYFAIKTFAAVCGLALVIGFVHFPVVTHDKTLVSFFGGFFIGAGIGLSMRAGSVLDGTDLLAIFVSKRIGATIGDIILGVNIIIFSAAAYFLSLETALYSLITYLAASKTLDFIIEGIEEYTGVTIISARSDEMRSMIIHTMGRGVTVYKGKRGFGTHGHRSDIDIVYTVITRLEISKLNSEIDKIDTNAFVVMNSVKDTKGGMVKKRRLKH